MGARKKQGWKCPEETCQETFKNQKELKKHTSYHHHQETKTTDNITIQGILKLDRRKPLQEGTPQENKFIYNNNIKFDTKHNKWICQRCNKTYGPNSMRNAIQHARHHIITGPSDKKQEKWHEWTEEEKTIRDCRIRTLRKHNPWGETRRRRRKKRQQG